MDQEIALSRNLKKSDGSIITFSILIIGLVAVIFLLSSEFPSAAGFRNSLADVQPVQDSIARSDQNVIPPRSFTRGISEVIQLSSVSGVPGQTNHYTRAIAENIGVTSSPSGPSAARAQTEVGSVSRNEYSGFSSASNKRAEEKIGVLLKSLNKRNVITQSMALGGTTQSIQGYEFVNHLESPTDDLEPDGSGESAERDDYGSSNNSSNWLGSNKPQFQQTLAESYGLSANSANAAIFLNTITTLPYLVLVLGLAIRPAEGPHHQPGSGQIFLHFSENHTRFRPGYLLAIIALLLMSGASLSFAGNPAATPAYADTNAAGAAYRSNTGTNTLNSPKYRQWAPSTLTWSSEVELPTTGAAVRDALILFSPVNSQRVILAYNVNGDIELYKCTTTCTTASNWVDMGVVATTQAYSTTTPYRPFYAAYESLSGNLVIVYDKATTETADFYWKTFDGFSLSAESSFNYIGSATADAEEIRFFRMASKPSSNEITMVLEDATNSDAYAFVWDGTTFGTQGTITTAMGNTSVGGEAIGVAYETSSGAAIAFAGSGANSASWARRPSGGSWGSASTVDPNVAGGNDVMFVSMKSDPVATSNKIMICQGDDLNDTTCAQEDNGTLGSWTVHATSNPSTTTRSFDFAWNPSGSSGLLVYETSGTADTTISQKTWIAGVWGVATTTTVASTVHSWITTVANPTDSDTINSLWTKLNSVFDVGGLKYDGTTFSLIGESTFTADTTVTTFEANSMAFQLSTASPIGTTLIAETISVSDSPSKNLSLSRAIADAATISVSAVGIRQVIRFTSEALSVAEALTRRQIMSRSPSDTIVVSDIVAKIAIMFANSSDSLNVTAVTSIIVLRVHSISDSLSISDVIRIQSSRSLVDSISINDQLHSSIFTSRAAADGVTTSDSILANKIISRGISDTIIFSDSPVKTVAALRTAADGIGVADNTLFVAKSVSRNVSQTISISDSPGQTILSVKSPGETLAISDTVIRMIGYSKSLSDSIGTSDSLGKSMSLSKVISDVLSLTDSIAFSQSVARSITDLIITSDSPTRMKSAQRVVADTVSLSELASRIYSPVIPASEALTVTDTLSAKVSRRVVSDQITLLDDVTAKISGHLVFVSEAVSVSDTPSAMYGSARSTSETLLLSDSLTRNNFSGRSVSDTIALADAVNTQIGATRSLSETITTTDSAHRVHYSSASISESIVSSDSIAKTNGFKRSVSDGISASDSAQGRIFVTRAIDDAMLLDDLPQAALFGVRGISEGLVLADTTSKLSATVRTVTDTLTTNASISGNISALRLSSDSFSISDGIDVNVHNSIPIAASLTILDSISSKYIAARQVSEGLGLVDGVSAKIAQRSVASSLQVTDDIDAKVTGRAASDEITLIDAIGAKITGVLPSDALILGDSISAKVTARSLSDTLAVDDQVVRNNFAIGEVSEMVGITESLTVHISATRSVADVVSATELTSTADLATRLGSDGIVVADSISQWYLAQRNLADTFSTIDQISAKVTTRTLADQVTVTDALSARITLLYLSDSINFEETIITKIAARAMAENIPLTDAILAKITAVSLSVSDTVSTTDAVSAKVDARAIADAVPISDTLVARITATSVLVADTLSLNDSVSAKVAARAIPDAFLVTDSLVVNVTARSISDSLALTDSVGAKIVGVTISENLSVQVAIQSKVAARSLNESITLSETISAKIGTRSASDSIAIFDSLAAAVVGREIVDSVSIGDDLVSSVNRQIGDEISTTDIISSALLRNISDAINIRESIITSLGHEVHDEVSFSDQISIIFMPLFDIGESITIQDEIKTLVSRSLSDFVTVGDSSQISSLTVNITDSVEVTDDSRIAALAINLADNINATEEATPLSSINISVQDSATIADHPQLSSLLFNTADEVILSDEIQTSVFTSAKLGDSISIQDEIAPDATPTLGEQLSLVDSISTGSANSVGDSLSIQDMLTAAIPINVELSENLALFDNESTETGVLVALDDTLTPGDAFSSVSVAWTLSFEDGLGFGDCTPFSCGQTLQLSDGLSFEDEYIPPPRPVDMLSVADSITVDIGMSRGLSDQITVDTDGVEFLIAPAAPPIQPGSPLPSSQVLIVTNTTLVEIPPTIGVNMPPLSWNGDPQILKDVLKPSAHMTNATLQGTDYSNVVIVLPTYHVPLTPTTEIPGNNLIMSGMLSEISAGETVYVPIDLTNTPSLSDQNSFAKWMSFGFTPNENTSNFALLVSVLNSQPLSAAAPSGDLAPLYLDIRWIGDVTGSANGGPSNPGATSYYQNLPQFTFVVTDQWAQVNNVQRDENGVPIIAISLLDEATGSWGLIPTIVPPTSAEDGVFKYASTLPHFSHYAITANKVATPIIPGQSHGGGGVSGYIVSIADSLRISDLQRVVSVENLEQFGQKSTQIKITDTLAIFGKPIAFNTLKVGNTNVNITLEDVKSDGSIFATKAVATFEVDMSNSGDKNEEFALHIMYYDENLKRWEFSQNVSLAPFESRHMRVPIAFTSPGVFGVIAEARSFPEKDLLNSTTIPVEIPWLLINLYILIIVASVIVSATAVALFLFSNRFLNQFWRR